MLGSGHCSRKPEAVASGLASGIYVAAGRNRAACTTRNVAMTSGYPSERLRFWRSAALAWCARKFGFR